MNVKGGPGKLAGELTMARDDSDAPCSGGEDFQVSLSLVVLEPLMIIGSVVKLHKPWIDGKNEGCMHDEKLDGGGDPRVRVDNGRMKRRGL
ncbi:ABC transporter ATP-binding protein [Sesbania bispinosa]|nr:ABC transporter ATP-binding protein [Sesbania bispinosa]